MFASYSTVTVMVADSSVTAVATDNIYMVYNDINLVLFIEMFAVILNQSTDGDDMVRGSPIFFL